METGIVQYFNEQFELSIPARSTREQLELVLAERINFLIANDFTQLVHVLYRIDVSEKKLKALLKQHAGTNAGNIIAILVIERQLEKNRSKAQFKKDDNISEDERW